MIDGGVIAGYLALAVSRGVDRVVSNKIDSILAALENRIKPRWAFGLVMTFGLTQPIHACRT